MNDYIMNKQYISPITEQASLSLGATPLMLTITGGGSKTTSIIPGEIILGD